MINILCVVINLFKNIYINLLLPSIIYTAICLINNILRTRILSRFLIHFGFILILLGASLSTVYDVENNYNLIFDINRYSSDDIKFKDLIIRVSGIELDKTFEGYLSIILNTDINLKDKRYNKPIRIDENIVYGKVIKPVIIRDFLNDYYIHVNYIIPEPVHYRDFGDYIVAFSVENNSAYIYKFDKNEKIIKKLYIINYAKFNETIIMNERFILYENGSIILPVILFKKPGHEFGIMRIYDDSYEIFIGNVTKRGKIDTSKNIKINITVKYNPYVNILWFGCLILIIGMILRFRRAF